MPDPRAPKVRLAPLDPRAVMPYALAWYRDSVVLDGSEGRGTPAYDRATIERMYAHLSRIGELYAIEVDDGGAWVPVGDAALCPDTMPIVVGEARFRGRGVGKAVLNLLIARARALGWQSLCVAKVYAYNDRAIALFEGAGFRLVGEARDGHGRPTRAYRLDLGQNAPHQGNQA